MTFTVRPDAVESGTRAAVKEFLLKACRFDVCGWPGYNCVIWRNNRPLKVVGGSTPWKITASEVYLAYFDLEGEPPPTWVPGALAAVAAFFRLDEDAQVTTAIDSMIEILRSELGQARSRATVWSHSGRPVRKIALHNLEPREAAFYNVAKEGEPEDNQWREHDGSPIEIDEHGNDWTIVSL